jgi:KAP family P-loop domain
MPTASPAFPPLESSPYAVRSSGRRERWWFSDGIWLNQGQTGDVVGFAWTHWLADRGLEVPGTELGADFATQLQREAQALGGGQVGPEYGARVEVAAQILVTRGLVEECYSFESVDAIVGAVLERGPVVAAFGWRQGMFTPVDADGWSVCRFDPDESVAGGHCVLLNGVALDLVIDGVTGFVRLKNTWGRDWADDGQALISIADLSAVIDLERSLLPIPHAIVLRPGVRQDAATDDSAARRGPAEDVPLEDLPSQPREVRFEQTAISGDLATRRDTVGAAAYAEAIARGIQHPDTKAPLTIGIKAPWGAGKTSLMRMIRDRLEWPDLDGSSEKLRQIHLTTAAARRVATTARKSAVTGSEALGKVTNLAVLRKLRHTGEEATPGELKADLGKAGAGAPPRDQDRWRPTVWFNPWMYQTGEQVWAGLANEIIGQVTERMTRGEREHFWLYLNRARVDEQAVRRKIYALVLSRAVPYAIFGLIVLAGGIVLLAVDGTGWVGGSVALAGPAVAVAGGALAGWRALGSHVGATLTPLVRPATDARQFASGQLAGSYSELVVSPDYRAQAGYLYLVHTDIRRVLDLVATPDRPLVIFVDDLDRCSPGTVVQVIEAINIFVAGAYPNCVFVIAMEPEMVAAHIEAAYSSLVHQLDDTAGTATPGMGLGWRFLEKIVQLPLALPAMEPEMTVSFIESLFPAVIASGTAEATASETASGTQAAAASGAGAAGQGGAAGGDVTGVVRPDAVARREARRVIERRLTASDPEVRRVIEYASEALNRNPREIKRFVNLFRFYTMIYAERKLVNLPTPASLHEVAKLAVLGIRWPSLLGCLALPVKANGLGQVTVFELLEKPLGNDIPGGEGDDQEAIADQKVRSALRAAGLGETTITCLLLPELTTFLRAEPIVGPRVRGYL